MKIIILAIFLFQINIAFGQVSLKNIGLERGNHSVGFKHYLAHDSTRTYKRIYDWNNKSIARPVPISIWYPSNGYPKGVQPMQVVNYMEILKEEEEWEYLPTAQILNWFYYSNTTENKNHLKEKANAYYGAKPANGKFSVIVYAPSYQASSIENFALCEYLASHGYVVISSPSRGTENRLLEGGAVKDMETQARDIEFLIKEATKLRYANPDQIASMGFSFGGLSNVLSQMRNKNIKALVSLDGSVRYQYATLTKSPYFNIKKVNVPFIHFAQKDIPEEVLKADKLSAELNYKFDFYDSLTNSSAYKLKFHNLTHAYFSTLGVLFQQRDKRQDKTDSEIMESYRWVSVYTLNFLNAHLKKDINALKFIINQPVDNGIKNGLITLEAKRPDQTQFSFQDFNELATKQNYTGLEKLYTDIKKRYPSVEIPEGSLNNLGLQLVFNPKTSERGIRVFLFATAIYPQSANLFDSLAEAYLFVGNKEKAIENFKKSLSLDEKNQNAIDRLKELSGKN